MDRFCFPENPVRRTAERVGGTFKSCRQIGTLYMEENFYYCNVSWCAEQSGHFQLRSEDYIDLEEIDQWIRVHVEKIVELSRGTSSFCKICRRLWKDNTNYVPTGMQMKRNIKKIDE